MDGEGPAANYRLLTGRHFKGGNGTATILGYIPGVGEAEDVVILFAFFKTSF